MSTTVAEVRSETAYDALQDGLPLLLRVLSGTHTVDELARAEHAEPVLVEKHLGRLVRAGLLRKDNGSYEAVASAIRQTRQEGMVTFLSRYFLPLVTRIVQEEEGQGGFAVQLDLVLSPEEQEALREGAVHQMQMDLAGISEEPATEHVPCTAVVVGTSDVPAGSDPGERLLETVRRCAKQRSTPGFSGRAVLTQLDGLYGVGSVEKAEERVRRAAEAFSARRPAVGQKPSYTLVLGFCARPVREWSGR